MQLTLRLAHLLKWDEKKRRGIIREICHETGLERYQVSDLLHNKVKYLSLDTLSKVCDYLVARRILDAEDVPGELFNREPDGFWPLLRDRKIIEVVMGARSDPHWRRDLLVSAADAELQSRIFKSVTGAGEEIEGKRKPRSQHGLILDPRLVTAPDLHGKNLEKSQREAVQLHHQFAAEAEKKALVLLGSVKSNLASELAVAETFARARAFSSEDHVGDARERSCPFFMLYRKTDPQHPSCCAGQRLSRTDRGRHPGMYFEQANGDWECFPWTEETADAALVFYRWQKTQVRVDMQLGGFSGRATRALAYFLRSKTHRLWPPTYETDDVAIGAFLLWFKFDPLTGDEDSPAFQKPIDGDAVPLAREVIERRLLGAGRKRAARKKPANVGPPPD